MDFAEAIKALASKAQKDKGSLNTEADTKAALVVPFIQLLGYDTTNPREVKPEFTADIAGRRGEKVDYAIMQDDNPIMIIECKCCGANLNEISREQLCRYFLTLDSSIGILTDGIRYLFFSTAEDGRNMDATPFMEFSLDNIDPILLPELHKLCKDKFNLQDTLDTVTELKFKRQVKLELKQNLESVELDFVTFLMRKAGMKYFKKKTIEQFTQYAQRAFKEFINEQVDSRLKKALEDTVKDKPPVDPPAPPLRVIYGNVQGGGIETTKEEIEGYLIVKAILCEAIDPERVFLSDGINFCSIVLDNNKFKLICRMYFNSEKVKYFETIDPKKKGVKHTIDSLSDIYRHADALKATAAAVDAKSKKQKTVKPDSKPHPMN